jgi:biotin transporter BioY
VVAIIAWFFHTQQYEGIAYLVDVPLSVKHTVNFSYVIFFGVIGYFALKTYREPWLLKLWVVVYLAEIAILTIVGILDLVYRINSVNLREFFAYTRLFFSSPLPFGILAFLLRFRARAQTQR